MTRWVVPLMLGFGIAMAVIIGQRMSTDAMAVVLGVAVGVGASVPTSVLIVALLRREKRTWHNEQPQMPPPPAYPQMQQPVIMLNPAALLGQQMAGQGSTLPLLPPDFAQDGGLRRLRVVGDDDEWSEGG
jgi:hypothetical protein